MCLIGITFIYSGQADALRRVIISSSFGCIRKHFMVVSNKYSGSVINAVLIVLSEKFRFFVRSTKAFLSCSVVMFASSLEVNCLISISYPMRPYLKSV